MTQAASSGTESIQFTARVVFPGIDLIQLMTQSKSIDDELPRYSNLSCSPFLLLFCSTLFVLKRLFQNEKHVNCALFH